LTEAKGNITTFKKSYTVVVDNIIVSN